MKPITALLLGVLGLCQAFRFSPAPPTYEYEAVLHGDVQVFPLTLVDAFPFITAEVNGQKGKFMFDTGTEPALLLNSHRLRLKPGKAVPSGSTGSGQTFRKSVQDTVSEVKFANGLTYRNLLHLESANLDFLEDHVTPDYSGQIGFRFFSGYLFKLDYTRQQITFYQDTPQRRLSQDFLKGEKVVAVLPFETRKTARIPIVELKVGKQKMLGTFDTGQYGELVLSNASRQSLSRRKLVKFGLDGLQDSIGSLQHVRLAKGLRVNLPALTIYEGSHTKFLDERLGITEPNVVGLGYRFLAQYTTVWDYAHKQIYVLKKIGN